MDWSESSLKFGSITPGLKVPFHIVPGGIILGFVSGLLGPFFINVNTRVNAIRAKIWTQKWHKLIDCFIFAFATASCWYWLPYAFGTCITRPEGDAEKMHKEKTDTLFDRLEDMTTSRGWCSSPTEYNPLATLFWKTEGGLIRQIMGTAMQCTAGQMIVFTIAWYFFTITTYGVNVPSGLFLPGMIIGCGLGDLYIFALGET